MTCQGNSRKTNVWSVSDHGQEIRMMKSLTAINIALNLLHLFILVCGGLIVMMVAVIQGNPNFSPGWLLIILGGVTVVAGASGIGRTVGPCFWINMVFNSLAAFGSVAFSLASFSDSGKVAQSFRSKRYSAAEVESFIGRVTWAFYFLVTAEVLGVFFGSLARRLKKPEAAQDSFERRSIALQRLSIDLAAKDVRRASKQASRIAEKMNEKYGQWSHE